MDLSARLTSQVMKRNRVTFSYQPQYRCLGSTLTTSGRLPRPRQGRELGAGGRQRDGPDDTFRSGARQVWPDGERDWLNDLTPRMGAAYDLFGNGKTALKASAGKYLSAATADGVYSSQNQGLNYVRTASRAWTDSNGDRSVDCNLLSPAAQNTSATGGDICGALTGSNLNFGNLDPNTTRIDPAILSGWGIRPYNWNYGVSVAHEVRPGLSVDLGYTAVLVFSDCRVRETGSMTDPAAPEHEEHQSHAVETLPETESRETKTALIVAAMEAASIRRWVDQHRAECLPSAIS